ncbi:MAG: amidohydrolase family protein [Verrucomicrobia bacterium]|nr:amidohydrolase family protein [Verrucomicrobiota bacterium]
MQVIDSHVHLYPPELNADPAAWAAAHGEAHWAKLCTRRRPDGGAVQTFPTVEDLLREMDRAGVERAVLLGWYWERPETCAWQNRFYGRCVREYPDRLLAYATVHPRAGHWPALSELHRARDEGLVGIGELSPHSQGFSIDDPVFGEILTLAADWKMPVNLHVTDPEGRDYPGRIGTPLADFVRLAQNFPKTKFTLAHWGGLLPLRDPEARDLDNLFYDSAASPLLYDRDIWGRFAAALPPGHVLFGSDYPLNVYPKLGAEPEMTRMIAEARAAGAGEAIMRDNALRLLSR